MTAALTERRKPGAGARKMIPEPRQLRDHVEIEPTAIRGQVLESVTTLHRLAPMEDSAMPDEQPRSTTKHRWRDDCRARAHDVPKARRQKGRGLACWNTTHCPLDANGATDRQHAGQSACASVPLGAHAGKRRVRQYQRTRHE